jgi:xylulose-5-phosphate/fructose-6-phosphate phosphoketolase
MRTSAPRSFACQTLELTIRNQVDRFNLAIDVIDRVPTLQESAAHVKEWLKGQIIENIAYAYSAGIDRPEIRNWRWPSADRRIS